MYDINQLGILVGFVRLPYEIRNHYLLSNGVTVLPISIENLRCEDSAYLVWKFDPSSTGDHKPSINYTWCQDWF